MKRIIVITLTILLSLFLFIMLVIVAVNKYNTDNKYKKEIDNFKHLDIKDVKLMTIEAEDNEGTKIEYYRWDGYNIAKIYFNENIPKVIEEKVFDVKSSDDFEGQTNYSILYSKDGLTKSHAHIFIHTLHNDASCGVDLKKYQKIKDNYFIAVYDIYDDC